LKDKILKIFIGYDPIESIAFHTLVHSIYSRASGPVAITPLNIKNLEKIYTRENDSRQSNEFSFTRFLIPYLTNYSGYAIFMDCDQMLRTDIFELINDIQNQESKSAVHVVKHDYKPTSNKKYLGKAQFTYPRKNWSSFVIWNCEHPSNKIVTPEFVNEQPASVLHRFAWLADDEIGELDKRWNWLVGEYENPPDDVKNVHWTIGGPYFIEYDNSDFSDEWFREERRMSFCLQNEVPGRE